MKVSEILIKSANKAKPVLVRVFPIEWLRAVKRKLVRQELEKIIQTKIEPFNPDKYPNGINLIGSIKAPSGLGQSCRLIENVLQNTDIDYSIYNYSQSPSTNDENSSYDQKISKELPYNINLLHINAHEFPLACTELSKSTWDYRYNIAFWLWEIEEFPDEWTECMKYLDEIWTPAEFVSESIRKKTSLPVKTVPYHVAAPIDAQYDRKYFNLPEDKFLFLAMYDSHSIMERKNPEAALNAFRDAFDSGNKEVGIVIKINHPQQKDLDVINKILEGYENVYLIKETLEKTQVNSLTKCVDVVVSLHRAEGFGLVLAEAMMLGVPTIATNWSSNTEFMNSEVACMVDYDLITLEEEIWPYKKGIRWADAKVSQASAYMQKLYEDRDFYKEISVKAKEYIDDKLGMKRAVSLIEKRISEIYDEN